MNVKKELTQSLIVTDSCLQELYIDKHSLETSAFQNFWAAAEKSGYTFNDDTIVPFVKIIFQPKSSMFYNDTLKLSECYILDSVNIHKIQIRGTKSINKNYHPNLNIEEWQFKNSLAASNYAYALTDYYKKDYGLKSPTAVLLKNQTVYIFETAAYMFIPEMEKIEKLLGPNTKICITNY